MSKDLHLSANSNDYNWLLTIFYIAYIVFQGNSFMWNVVPPHIWAALITLFWCVVAMLQASTTSWSGMMALRFLLGAAEASFGPGLPYYLSFFYLRNEIGLRIGILLSAGPIATCFSGALAYGITSGHSSIANWRLLFLVEGVSFSSLPVFLPTIITEPKWDLQRYTPKDFPPHLTSSRSSLSSAESLLLT